MKTNQSPICILWHYDDGSTNSARSAALTNKCRPLSSGFINRTAGDSELLLLHDDEIFNNGGVRGFGQLGDDQENDVGMEGDGGDLDQVAANDDIVGGQQGVEDDNDEVMNNGELVQVNGEQVVGGQINGGGQQRLENNNGQVNGQVDGEFDGEVGQLNVNDGGEMNGGGDEGMAAAVSEYSTLNVLRRKPS